MTLWGHVVARFVLGHLILSPCPLSLRGTRCSSMVRAFAHGAMGRQIDPSWCGPIELFPASAPRLV